MMSDLSIKFFENDLIKKENEKKYQITKYFEHFKEHKKTKHLKKIMHEELINIFKVKEKEKQFNNVFKNSLNGICTICCEELNYIEKENSVCNTLFNSVSCCFIKDNSQFYNTTPCVLDCGHLYHYNCIKKWFTYSHDQICPNCGI